MKRIVYLFILTLCLTLAFLDHDSNGVAYNPLFHSHDDQTSGASQPISMPCGLGGSENHKH